MKLLDLIERGVVALEKLANIETQIKYEANKNMQVEVNSTSLETIAEEEQQEIRDSLATKLNSRPDAFWPEDNMSAEELESMQN